MKYDDALELGKECGLDTPAEAINNVFAHNISLFEYDELSREEKELITDAKAHGIEFCPNCGMAMLNNECYMEKKFMSKK